MMEHLSLLLNRRRCVYYYYMILKQESIYSYQETKQKQVLNDNFLAEAVGGSRKNRSVLRLRPSQGWNELSHLQALLGDHSTLTVFYDGDKELQEVCASTLTNSKYALKLGYNMKNVHE